MVVFLEHGQVPIRSSIRTNFTKTIISTDRPIASPAKHGTHASPAKKIQIEPTIRFTTFAQHRIAYIVHPNERATHLPIVFIHGLTASVSFWEAAMPAAVRSKHSWYSLSLPLHFPSTYAAELNQKALSEQSFADLMDAAIREMIPVGKFILTGYSLGGFAALNYAAKYPERVASVVSIGGFMTGRAKGLEGVLQFFAKGRILRKTVFHLGWKVLQSNIFFLRLAVKFYAKNDRMLLNYPALEPTLQRIFPEVARHDIPAMRAWFRYLLVMDVMDEINSIICPVLVFAGDRDPIIPFQHQQDYAQRLNDARLVVLPGVGHVPFAEAPNVFERELVEWLQRFSINA